MSLLGRGLGWFVFSVLRIRRTHTIAALGRANFSQAISIARKVYSNLGTSVFELLWMAGRTRSRGSASPIGDVQIEGWERVEQAFCCAKGVVIATAHTGNWDLAGCAVAQKLPLTVITKHLSWRSLDAFWQDLRARQGIGLLDAAGSLTHAQRKLDAGESVAFLIDQAPMRHRGVHNGPFLGADAEHDATFAMVAARCRVPVVVAFPFRRADGHHVVRVVDILYPPNRPSKTWIRSATLAAAKHLEAMIREHPEQWLWLHRRWRRLAHVQS